MAPFSPLGPCGKAIPVGQMSGRARPDAAGRAPAGRARGVPIPRHRPGRAGPRASEARGQSSEHNHSWLRSQFAISDAWLSRDLPHPRRAHVYAQGTTANIGYKKNENFLTRRNSLSPCKWRGQKFFLFLFPGTNLDVRLP